MEIECLLRVVNWTRSITYRYPNFYEQRLLHPAGPTIGPRTPLIDTEKSFALKGGTAINLFYRNMPRLSVDIDLLYIPMEERAQALPAIRAALTRISDLITKNIPRAKVQNAHEQSDALRLMVDQDEVRIKIELSPVIRGTVFPEKRMSVTKAVEDKFGYAEMQVASKSGGQIHLDHSVCERSFLYINQLIKCDECGECI